eukprot:9557417-Ditylum_brightwellii.AAC.1
MSKFDKGPNKFQTFGYQIDASPFNKFGLQLFKIGNVFSIFSKGFREADRAGVLAVFGNVEEVAHFHGKEFARVFQ